MPLHDDEVPIDAETVWMLLRQQLPEAAELPISAVGAGTDNSMFRVGDDLVARLPRTPGGVRSLRKERERLPQLAPALTLEVPEPVFAGAPSADYPLDWSVYRWIDGAPPSGSSVADQAAFGRDLAGFVAELHAIGLGGATRADGLSWYRGGSLRASAAMVEPSFAGTRELLGSELDVDRLEARWREGRDLPDSDAPHVWLHGDLRPGNLLVRGGRLHAVIDFGALSIGAPDAEHAAIWDYPAAARDAYFGALDLDEPTWLRARAWAIGVAVMGIPYYWGAFPEFVAECRARLEAVLAAE
ncbi:aminoglycoside phosphotransferase family protein [Agromyces seonyuensis]|uniref:Phosphotransferase n=1 Tax=Agromyces seonyuensis TaxID=2662446 RepID=A0A6I4NW80_9MICO|nr:aminoglycoside phosphotransferase family protein [Agromyces seonyuensis]MWB98696.1 phosphotransferase [Agromyces seonyuensis]